MFLIDIQALWVYASVSWQDIRSASLCSDCSYTSKGLAVSSLYRISNFRPRSLTSILFAILAVYPIPSSILDPHQNSRIELSIQFSMEFLKNLYPNTSNVLALPSCFAKHPIRYFKIRTYHFQLEQYTLFASALSWIADPWGRWVVLQMAFPIVDMEDNALSV